MQLAAMLRILTNLQMQQSCILEYSRIFVNSLLITQNPFTISYTLK
jgi:hypothetical protein